MDKDDEDDEQETVLKTVSFEVNQVTNSDEFLGSKFY